METDKKHFEKSVALLLLFYFCCLLVFFCIEHFSLSTSIFSQNNFLNWDAMHYDAIRRNEYNTGMVAFFPLFPLLWSWFHIGSIGISTINGLIFIFSFSWLASVFNIQLKNVLLIASIPSFIFLFLPFSEAIFFLTSTMALVGLQKKNFTLLITGLFLAGLTRPVVAVFIPAILVLFFLSRDKSESALLKSGWLIVSCFVSFGLVLLLQYFQTGDSLAFFRVQKGWGNYFRIPAFPLSSWAGGFIVRLDAVTFLFGMIAAAIIAYLLINKLKNKPAIIQFEKSFTFSLCYLGILSLIILFTRGGVLNSLNRYLFCSAFFVIAINELLQRQLFNKKNVLILFVFSSVFWLLFASYVHIQALLKFEFLTLYLIFLLACTSENKVFKNIGYYSILGCNVTFMMIFFHRFLSGEWVG